LQKVFVSFGDQVGFADTLSGALDQIFGAGATGQPTEPTQPTDPTQPVDPDVSAARADLRTALSDARQALNDGQAALADGDFAAYGEAQDALAEALGRATSAEEALDAASGVTGDADAGAGSDVTTTPTPSPSASPAST
jgi:uncharacterized membrane protein (UPF0182 family)